MNSPFQLPGKKILITGASAGIGRAIAIRTSQQGAETFLTARNLIALNKTLALLQNGHHKIIESDLNDEQQIIKLVEDLPVLDGIVFNAGMIKTVPVNFIKKALIDEIFQVNFTSSVMLMQLLLKKKKINKGASICFISSLASEYMHIGNAAYSATKGAVNSYAKSLALELAPKQIRVNAILPGMIQTQLMDGGAVGAEQLENHMKNYPLGRFGTPDDVAHLAVYLLSDASPWMTGSLITLDGGYSLK
jgi:NAD(P)-dependent dehydrogenase (short-subunit alcohol dehydrogenase family)